MPLVSVIVPVFNSEKYIEKCCENLLNQTFKDYEVIFINDGSTDESLSLLYRLKEKYDHVHIMTKENEGQGKARNLGIKVCQSEWICFVDIDDQISNDYLEKFVTCSQKTQAEVIWCNANVVKGNEVSVMFESKTMTNSSTIDYFLHNFGPCMKMVKTSLIKENHLYFPEIRYYEDLAIMPVLGLFASKIAYIDEPLYSYYQHEGSTMHQKKYTKNLENIFDSLNYLTNYVNQANATQLLRDELEFIYIEHLLHAASLRFFAFDAQDQLKKIVKIMKENYPLWRKNKYFAQKDWKYRLVCWLFYMKQYGVLRKILK